MKGGTGYSGMRNGTINPGMDIAHLKEITIIYRIESEKPMPISQTFPQGLLRRSLM